MRSDLYTINRTRTGTLHTMARPRSGDWLDDEMSALAAGGIGVLVSLLTDAEMTELGLTAEPEAAQTAGLVFYRLPTPDRHVPEQAASINLAGTLCAHLEVGQSVAIHCRNGIGRASVLAATVLVLEGTEPADAWALISEARGLSVPDTTDQHDALSMLCPPQDLPAAPSTHAGRGDQAPASR
jgi:protein-tyrosine phosphatase